MQIFKTAIDSVLNTKDGLYFYDRWHNALWHSDKELGNIELLRCALTDVRLKNFISFGIFQYGDSLFIGSQISTVILEYRLKERRFYHYNFEDKSKIGQMYNHAIYKEKIVLIPTSLDCPLLLFDMNTKEYRIEKSITNDKKSTCFIYQYEDEIYIPEIDKSLVYRLHLDGMGVDIIKFPSETHLCSICMVNHDLYALCNEQLMLLKQHNGFVDRIVFLDYIAKEMGGRLVSYGKYIIVFPRRAKSIYIYDTEMGKKEAFAVPLGDLELCSNGSLLYGYYLHENKIYFLPWMTHMVYIFDFETKTFSRKHLFVKTEWELLDFCIYVQARAPFCDIGRKSANTIGNEIYKIVRNSLLVEL